MSARLPAEGGSESEAAVFSRIIQRLSDKRAGNVSRTSGSVGARVSAPCLHLGW